MRRDAIKLLAAIERSTPNFRQCSSEFLLREILVQLKLQNALKLGPDALLLDANPGPDTPSHVVTEPTEPRPLVGETILEVRTQVERGE